MMAGSVRYTGDVVCGSGPFFRITEKEYAILPARSPASVTTSVLSARFQLAVGEKTEFTGASNASAVGTFTPTRPEIVILLAQKKATGLLALNCTLIVLSEHG